MKTSIIFYVYCGLFLVFWVLVYSWYPQLLLSYSFLAFSVAWAVYRLPTIRSNETLQSFFIYERRMPRNEFVGTLVTTNVGFFSSVAFSTVLIVTMGIGPAIILVIAWAVGLIWFASFLPKLLPFFRQGSTVHEYIGRTYGKTPQDQRHLRFYSSIITFLLYLASVGAEIKFTSDVFSGPTHLNTTALSLALCVAGILYVSISGYRGVVSTDRLRFWAIMLGICAIYYYVLRELDITHLTFPASYFTFQMLTIGPSLSTLLSLVVLLTFYQFCVMDMWERCIAIANSDLTTVESKPDEALVASLRRMIAQSILPFVALFGAWYAIGLLALGQQWSTDPNEIIPLFISKLQTNAVGSIAGALVETLVVLCFTAAALSTIDGFIIAAVQTIIFDWLPSIRKDHRESHELDVDQARSTLNLARVLVLIVGALAVGIAYTSFQIMSFWVGMYSLMLSFFPAIFLSLFDPEHCKRRSARQVAFSIVSGALSALVVAILGTFFLKNTPILVALPPFIAAGTAFLILLPEKGQRMKVYVFVLLFTAGLAGILATRSSVGLTQGEESNCTTCVTLPSQAPAVPAANPQH